MTSQEQRRYFNTLRVNYFLSARILFLFNQFHNGCILYGYAIELVFKQSLVELGNKDDKLRKSHNLVLLLRKCQSKGLFKGILATNDFIEYSNSLFQMRYPSTERKESLKAIKMNKAIVWDKNLLFLYDDYFQQIDEALYQHTNDWQSCAILRLFAGIDDSKNQMGLHYNSAILRNIELYRERLKKYYPNNTASIQTLENDAAYFWKCPFDKIPYADFAQSLENRDISSFTFPGKVTRDKSGRIISIEI